DPLAVGELAGLGAGGGTSQRGTDRLAGVEAVEEARIDVRAAGDRRRVAELLGHRPDHLPRGPGAARLRVGALRARRQLDRGEHGRVPGPEVLGRELAARELAEVGVDLLRLDVDPATPGAARRVVAG